MVCGSARSGHAGDLDVQGVVAGRGLWVQGQETWLRGGFGRLPEGAGGAAESRATVRGQVHLGLDWKPSERWLVRAHGVVQGEPSSYGGRRVGLVEAFAQFRPELTPRTSLRFRLGTFFPQTSLENVAPLWQSPYTLTLSALNTWTAEELRLTGLEAAVLWKSDRDDRFEVDGGLFGFDDTLGALLAWRGWTLGDRLSTVGETLPLPPLKSLGPGRAFAEQQPGTQPIDELDRRAGWQARARWSRPHAAEVRVAYLDTRGDRRLHSGQYAWDTSFTTAGVELRLGPSWRLLAEGAAGDTGMGPAVTGGPRVALRFRAGYVLLSWGRGKWRLSTRVDGFRNRDLDGTAEPGQESGRAWTVAVLWQPLEAFRIGAEYLDLRAQRPAAAYSAADPDTDARRGVIELRLTF